MGMHGGLQVLNRDQGERLVRSLGPDYAELKCWVKEFGLCPTGNGLPWEIIFQQENEILRVVLLE